MNLTPNFPYYLDVSTSGYLFVEDLSTDAVDVFAPGAHGSDGPIEVINNWGAQSAGAVVLGPNGRLFVTAFAAMTYVYDDPLHQWKHENQHLVPMLPETFFTAPLAYDQTDDVLYQQCSLKQKNGHLHLCYAAHSFNQRPPQPDKILLTKNSDCEGYEASGVISGEYLISACNGAKASLIVRLKDDFGPVPQPVLKYVGRFQSPIVVRLGP